MPGVSREEGMLMLHGVARAHSVHRGCGNGACGMHHTIGGRDAPPQPARQAAANASIGEGRSV